MYWQVQQDLVNINAGPKKSQKSAQMSKSQKKGMLAYQLQIIEGMNLDM